MSESRQSESAVWNEPKLLLEEWDVDGKIQLVLAAVSVDVVTQHIVDVVANLNTKKAKEISPSTLDSGFDNIVPAWCSCVVGCRQN